MSEKRSRLSLEESTTVAQTLNRVLGEELKRDPRLWLLGEDIGPYGGIFKVTDGLAARFGDDRVRDTPISEASMAGIAVGSAMVGSPVVLEFQYSDFMLLAMDAIVNQAAKMRYMTGGQATVPVVFRAPVGAAGLAAQHSQTLTSWFAHIPGLKVFMPADPASAERLLRAAIRDPGPVVFLEDKKIYFKRARSHPPQDDVDPYRAEVRREGTDVTIAAMGHLVGEAEKAASALQGHGIDAEVVAITSIKPLDIEGITASVRKTGRLVIAEEASEVAGVAAYVSASVSESALTSLRAPVRRLTTGDTPFPAGRELERSMLVTADQIRAAVTEVCATPDQKPEG